MVDVGPICGKCGSSRRRAVNSRNTSVCADCTNRIGQERKRRTRAKAIAAYGGKCACPRCDITNPMFLTFDHINGAGRRSRHDKTSHQLLAQLKREGWPRGQIQLLCWLCNCGRALNDGICPHFLEDINE